MNYKHLYYFWKAAKADGIVNASDELHLTPQTVSGQIQLLEEDLGTALFRRKGRRVELTEAGRVAFEYAQDIFSLGSELEETLRLYPAGERPVEFRVGVSDALPKPIAYELLAPALELNDPVRIVCREWKIDRLLSELAMHRLDLVLTDAPIPPGISIRAFNHRLGESSLGFFARPTLAKHYRTGFPECLDGAPVFLPGEDSAVRGKLVRWLDKHRIRPRILGEFDDSALMQAFAQAGKGLCVAPLVMEQEIVTRYGLQTVGRADEVSQEFFAVSVERRLTHPCVVAITESARSHLFVDAS